MNRLLTLTSALGLSTAAFGQVQISEIRIDQSGSDNDEYFELAGVPGAPLDGLSYVVIGDGSGGSGSIDAVIDLTGSVIPASGLFVAAESSFTLGAADLTTSINFENGDNVTHLLVAGNTAAAGDDLDTDDDGVLDVTPWTMILDGVALIEEDNPPTGTEFHYGNLPNTVVVGPDGSFVPAHVFRCSGGFEIGLFGDLVNDTPGAANACPPGPQPTLINEIRIDQPGSDVDEYFEIIAEPGTSLDGLSYVVIGDGAGGSGVIDAVIDLTGQVVPADGHFLATEDTFTLGASDLVTSINFENSDNVTHLLVAGNTAATGDDLDTDDDGVLDVIPWTEIIDGIALIEEDNPPSGTEFHYGDLPNTVVVGPDGSFVPGHVFRCEDGVRIGSFGTGAITESPGEPNFCPALTTVFCSPALPNSVSADGSTLSLVSASGGSIAANDSMLMVSDTPDDFGFFAQSMSTIAPTPLMGGGNLCLGFPDIQRLGAPVVASGNVATYALDFVGGGPETMTTAGVTMHYQWWHRDTTPGGSNLSEGLAVHWIE